MATFGRHLSRPAQWLSTGVRQTRRVGKVEVTAARRTGAGDPERYVFSGILLDGDSVSSALSGLPIFLTCRHGFVHGLEVDTTPQPISDEVLSSGRVIFEGMFDDPANSVVARFAAVLAYSPPSNLNFALLLLDGWPGTPAEINMAPQPPEPGGKVYVIGYSGGRTLSISFDDNEVVERDTILANNGGLDVSRVAAKEPESQIFYRAPTQGGSSGSPVFNEFWELAALHVGRWERANIGIRIDALLDSSRQQLTNTTLPTKLLDQIRATRGRTSRAEASADFFSVFISYSHADAAFADRLHKALLANGVRAWLDRHQMQPGDDIYEQINRGIQMWDKVLLCCSQHSLTSWWVDNELDTAFQKERELMKERGHKVLAVIPLNLDNYMFEGKWHSEKAQQIKSRLAANFIGWKSDSEKFEAEFQHLLQALMADESSREIPPLAKL